MPPLQPVLRRSWPLFLGALAFLLTACPGVSGGGNGGTPQITSFTASQSNVTAGTPVTLNWVITGVPTSLSLKGSDGTSLSSLIGTSTTVTPTVTTTYTLTATNSNGSSDETTLVTVGGTVPLPPGGSSTLSFGVSNTQDGTFQNDAGSNITSASDPRVVDVAAGSTFYAQVAYSGPSPVTGVTIYLANQSPANFSTDLVQGAAVNGFTLQEAVGSCAVDGTQTSVTCVYPITVALGTPNITGLPGVSGEFAYVLRARVTDAAGATNMDAVRGYVTVGDNTGAPPTNPPPTSPPSGNEDPVAAFTSTQMVSDTTGATYKFSAAASTDPDGNALTYAWNFGDGTAGTGRDFTKKYTASGLYKVTLTVDDGNGGSDTETLEVQVGSAPPSPTTYNLAVSQTGDGNVRASPKGEACGQACTTYDAGTAVTLTAVPNAGSVFSGWGGACAGAGTATTCTLTVNGPTSVMATFNKAAAPTTYQLKVLQLGKGKGNVRASPSGQTCGTACTSYGAGTEVTLTGVESKGSLFAGWGGDCEDSIVETCTLTIDSNKEVVADFIVR